MTIIEREPAVRSAPREPERPVFLAADGRRARRLRVVAFAVTVLAVLWLVALAAGTLGFGSLPGFSVPQLANLGGGGTPPPGPGPAQRSEARGSAERVADATTRSGRVVTADSAESLSAPQRRGTIASPGKAKPVRPHPRRPAPAQPATPVQPAEPVQAPQAQAPPPPQTGRERRGLPAPPGQARKTEPAPPPPGNRRGQDTTTPPPPPPPPGNGNGGGPKK
jgi:hypothetical protein